MTMRFEIDEVEETSWPKIIDWKNDSQYNYIDNVINEMKSIEQKIKKKHNDYIIVNFPYEDYVAKQYHWLRRRYGNDEFYGMNRFIKNIELHFAWFHCKIVIAWEYIRRNKNYAVDFTNLKEFKSILYIEMCEKWGILQGSKIPDPKKSIPPIFMPKESKGIFSAAVLPLAQKIHGIYSKSALISEENFPDNSVALILHYDRSIESQLIEVKELMSGIGRANGVNINENEVDNRKRLASPHKQYLRVLDAFNEGIHSPTEIGSHLFPHQDRKSAADKVEKQLRKARKLSEIGYLDIATMPFRR